MAQGSVQIGQLDDVLAARMLARFGEGAVNRLDLAVAQAQGCRGLAPLKPLAALQDAIIFQKRAEIGKPFIMASNSGVPKAGACAGSP